MRAVYIYIYIIFLLTFYLQLVNSRFTSVFFAAPTWFVTIVFSHMSIAFIIANL